MDTYTGITPSDVTSYRDKLNKLLGTDQIGGVWTPPKTGLTYPSIFGGAPVATPSPVAQPVPITPAPVATLPVTKTPVPVTITPTPTPTPATPYAGGSIVDYLSSTGKPSDFASRSTLAKNAGIQNYTGTAEQNIQLLNSLRGGTTSVPTPVTTTTPTTATKTPEQIAAEQAKTTQMNAEQAGRAGLSIADWSAINAPTEAESTQIANELGITKLEGEVFKKPSQTSQEIFDKAYSTSGLADVKVQITKINDEINKSREELRVATGKIDENPFLTEQSRVGRGKRLLAQYEAKITNQLDQMTRLQGLYDKGISEINNIITRNTADFGVNQAIDQAQLNYLQKKAEVQATKLAQKKITEGLPSYLKGKAASAKPEVIGTAETGFFKYDPTLQKFVQVVKGIPKVTTATTFAPSAEQKSLVGRFLATEEAKKLGASSSDFVKSQTDPEFFYYLLQKANESGIY